ncbi:tetratricopeptide repeat protein [Tenacibaculum agarivorans]|uniref:tetratricopeptide repeat protein n=1 Tax=Tenacibaculum agarivorans TaxID=1908389 RepID=UPI00094B82FF|nr:tetratricopeptide repeat protein [Tenacibaculum agarivorans]
MDYTNKIEKFLTKEMDEQERLEFLKELETNAELKDAIAIYSSMRSIYDDEDWELSTLDKKDPRLTTSLDFLQSEKGKQIAAVIQQEKDTYFAEIPKQQKGIRKMIITFGSIAAIFIIGFFLSKNFTTASNFELYSDYKNNWEELPSLTVRGNADTLTEVETLFKQQNYAKASELLEHYLKNNTNSLDPQLLLYSGILQLELNKNEEAIETFTTLLQSNTLDAYKAHWYLALSYLKLDNTASAKQELQKIVSTNSNFKYKEAQELLEEIE